MSASELQVRVRPMTLMDIDDVLSLDQILRESDVSLTYTGFSPIRQTFGMNVEKDSSSKRPNLSEVTSLIELSLLAESEGTLVGFIVGRQKYLAEYDIQAGEIAMIGVNRDYRGKGVGTKLINALDDLFRSRGVQSVRVGIDPLDKDLLAFFEKEGFSGERILYYSKTL